MKKILLALVACLAITGISFADFSLGHDPGVDVGDGLISYQVYITGTSPGGGLASAFDSLNVSGEAVQLETAYFGSTVSDIDITKWNPMIDQSYLAKDTHVITPAEDWVGVIGGATESNDGSISTVLAGSLNQPHTLGLGAITSTAVDAYSFATQAGDVYFLQVVLQEGKTAEVSLRAFGNDTLGNPCSLTIPVPEPSTIVMLVLGALCLLIRRK